MTKSRKQKRIHQEYKTKGFCTASDILPDAGKGFLFDGYERHRLLEHCRKNKILLPGQMEEGDTVCLMRIRPKKRRRRSYEEKFWKIRYLDRSNGFIQLENQDSFDKEGAEENIAFLRSHTFPITDVWNLETAFTLFFLPRLKVFIESTRYSIPGNIYNQYLDKGYTPEAADTLASEEWEQILKRMYDGLTLYAEGPDAEPIRKRIRKEQGPKNQKELWDIEHTMKEDAQKLFSEWFFALWD